MIITMSCASITLFALVIQTKEDALKNVGALWNINAYIIKKRSSCPMEFSLLFMSKRLICLHFLNLVPAVLLQQLSAFLLYTLLLFHSFLPF